MSRIKKAFSIFLLQKNLEAYDKRMRSYLIIFFIFYGRT